MPSLKTQEMQRIRAPPTNLLHEISSYIVDTGFSMLKHFKKKNLFTD
jgi:hypothetical protein